YDGCTRATRRRGRPAKGGRPLHLTNRYRRPSVPFCRKEAVMRVAKNAMVAFLISGLLVGGWLVAGGAGPIGLAQSTNPPPVSILPQNSLCYLLQGGQNAQAIA